MIVSARVFEVTVTVTVIVIVIVIVMVMVTVMVVVIVMVVVEVMVMFILIVICPMIAIIMLMVIVIVIVIVTMIGIQGVRLALGPRPFPKTRAELLFWALCSGEVVLSGGSGAKFRNMGTWQWVNFFSGCAVFHGVRKHKSLKVRKTEKHPTDQRNAQQTDQTCLLF